MVMTVMIKLVLTNVSLKLDISTVDSCNLLKQALTLIFVMTLLTIFTITATEIRIKHRKHNRWKRRSLSTHRYYIYGTKRRCSRIGISTHTFSKALEITKPSQHHQHQIQIIQAKLISTLTHSSLVSIIMHHAHCQTTNVISLDTFED